MFYISNKTTYETKLHLFTYCAVLTYAHIWVYYSLNYPLLHIKCQRICLLLQSPHNLWYLTAFYETY